MWPWSKRTEPPLSEPEILEKIGEFHKARQDFQHTATGIEAQLDRARAQAEVARHSGEAPSGYVRAGERHAAALADRLNGVQQEIARLTRDIDALTVQGAQAGVEHDRLLRAQGTEDAVSHRTELADFDRRLAQGRRPGPEGEPGGGTGGTLLVMFTDFFERSLELLDRAKARSPVDNGGAEGAGHSMPDRDEGAGGHTGGMSEKSDHDPAETSFEPPDEPDASFDRPAGREQDDFLPPDEPMASHPSERADASYDQRMSFGPFADDGGADFPPPEDGVASYPPPDASFPPPPN